MIAVDLLLAASRNGAGSGHLGRNVTADTIDAARQIAGRPAARFLFEGRRRLHVHLHHVSMWPSLNPPPPKKNGRGRDPHGVRTHLGNRLRPTRHRLAYPSLAATPPKKGEITPPDYPYIRRPLPIKSDWEDNWIRHSRGSRRRKKLNSIRNFRGNQFGNRSARRIFCWFSDSISTVSLH